MSTNKETFDENIELLLSEDDDEEEETSIRTLSSDRRRKREEKRKEKIKSAAAQAAARKPEVPVKKPWWRGYSAPKNPGKFELLDKEVNSIMMPKDLFDGVLIEVRRPIYGKTMRNMFDLAHSFIFGSSTAPTSYTFASTWHRNSHKLHGRINFTKQIVTGMYTASLFPGLSTTFQASTTKKGANAAVTITRKGDDYTAALDLATTGKVESSYTQMITDRLSSGVKIMHEPMAGTEVSMVARYATPEWVGNFGISSFGNFSLSYTHFLKNRKTCALSTQLTVGRATPDEPVKSVVALGARYDLLSMMYTARVDTTGRCLVALHEKILPHMSVMLCIDADYAKDIYKLGIGGILTL